MVSKSSRKFIVHMVLCAIPSTRLYTLKSYLFRWAGLTLGQNVRIVSSARVLTSGTVVIGDDSFLGHECLIVGGNAPVRIGAYVDIGPRVTFVTGTHVIKSEGPHVAGKGLSLPIDLGEGCWVCAGAIILGGTTIGPRSIVMAGAVVRGVFPEGCVIGGVPARIVESVITAEKRK